LAGAMSDVQANDKWETRISSKRDATKDKVRIESREGELRNSDICLSTIPEL